MPIKLFSRLSDERSRPTLPTGRRGKARRKTRDSERGLALIAVLWALALLGVIAASFAFETRTGTRVAQNIVENAKAEALADGAVYRTIELLLDGVPANDPFADGRSYRLAFTGGEATVSLQDTAGLIDLNQASDKLLTGLFESVDVDTKATAALVDAIEDFRDPNDERRPHGAEDRDYQTAGLSHGAKDGPFETVEELQQVFGMTSDLYQLVAPALTVDSRRPAIHPAYAPAMVLKAIPGMDPNELNAFLKVRTRRGWGHAQLLANRATGGGEDFVSSEDDVAEEGTTSDGDYDGEAEAAGMDTLLPAVPHGNDVDSFYTFSTSRFTYLIRAEAKTQGGGIFVREAAIRLSGRRGHPFIITSWRQGDRSSISPAH